MSRAAALLVLPLLLPLLPVVEAQAEGTARWIGPTGMLEGWHVRVPVRVENPLHREVLEPVVSHDLMLGEALVDAGWAVTRKGSSVAIESFELDPDSVRVVEYLAVQGGDPIDGILVGEVPSKASRGLHNSTRPFHNRTQPDLHVEWVVPGSIPANGTRTFFIYADTLTNGKKDPAVYSEEQMAPIHARGWVSRGTTLYGTAAGLSIVGLENDTLVRVELYTGTTPGPISNIEGKPNPITIHRGQVVSTELSTSGSYVRILADKPVAAVGTPTRAPFSYHTFTGVIPSADGGLLGTEFIIPANHRGVVAIMAGDAAIVTTDAVDPPRITLSPSRPVGGVSLLDGARPTPTTPSRVTSTAPILLMEMPGAYMSQFPSVHGAPDGSRIIGMPYISRSGDGSRNPCLPSNMVFVNDQYNQGRIYVTTHDEPTSVRGRDALSSAFVFPRESATRALTTGVNITPGTFEQALFQPTINDCPVLLHSTRTPEDTVFLDRGRITAWGGPNTPPLSSDRPPLSTPLGASGAMSFWSAWPVAIVAHHNGTTVEVTQAGVPDVRKSLGKGNMLEAGNVPGNLASNRNPIHIVASKPVTVLSQNPGGWFTGFDDSLRVVSAGKPQYRGYLVSIEPATLSTEPMQGIAAPGKGATYRLLVKNLAKDDRGDPVADAVDVRMGGIAEGWRAELSDTLLRLEPGGSREVILKVTPPDDAKEGARARLTITVGSQGNPKMMDNLQVITTIRASYEVGIWFDRENAPPGKTITLDPDETKDVKVVVKNLASVPDRILVRATASSPDWKARFADAPGAIADIALEPGEARTLVLRLTAPSTKAATTNLEIRATSASDASASAKQDATARVRADVRIALLANETLAEGRPGDLVTMRVLFENRGTDRVSIKFNTTGAMPAGWSRAIVRQGGYEIDELSGIVPGDQVPLDISVRIPANATRGDRANLHFFVETMPQFVGDPVLREALDLLVMAGARHDLTPIDPVSSLSLGFADSVRAQLSLANGGNGIETLRVVPADVPEGAGVLVGGPARVPVGGRGAVDLTLAFAPGTPAGTYPVLADVVADDGTAFPWRFNVTVPERRLATLTPQGPLVGIAGVDERVRFDVSNGGNVPLRLPPRLLLPDGWTPKWTGPEGFLEVGGSQVLTLHLTAPSTATPQTYSLVVDPTWATSPPIPWDLRTVQLSAEAAFEEKSVVVRLRNAGTGDAYGVEVILLQGSTEVDRAVIQRLAANGNATALLAPRAGVTGELRVVVDNETIYAPDPIVVGVSGAERIKDVPAPGALLTLALAAFAAVAIGRRLRAR